jgi:hypothetical protein
MSRADRAKAIVNREDREEKSALLSEFSTTTSGKFVDAQVLLGVNNWRRRELSIRISSNRVLHDVPPAI